MNENEMNQVPEEKPVEPAVEIQEKPISSGDHRSFMEIAIAVVAVVLIVATMAAMMMGGIDMGTTDPTTAATIPPAGNHDDATCKGSYTAEDAWVKENAGAIVATMGDVQMSNEDLQVYYWMQVNSFLNEYGAYASVVGLDMTQPLDTQSCMMAEGMTWQQYFLRSALESWQAYQALAMEAIAAGFDKQSQDYQTYAAGIREELRSQAESLGYASLAEAVTEMIGAGGTEDAYVEWLQTTYLGALYYDVLLAERMTASDADIEAYFEQHAAEYAESGLDKETGNYVDVRHILIMPQGGTLSEDGKTTTYSDAEWEAARAEAQDILDQWLSGDATEEEFGDLANSHSHDSDGTDGGLYTDVYQGQMVPEFDAWCFDEARVVGDYGLVKTQYGYHVMYFSGRTPIWYATAKSDLETEIANTIVPEILEKYETTFHYEEMCLGHVDLA